MEFIKFVEDVIAVEFAGNKAARLAELRVAGYRVPTFFVIGSGAANTGCRAALQEEIAVAARRLAGNAAQFAVRSSSVEEDGAEKSFAGQFASFLRVSSGDIGDYALKVWESASSTHIKVYRQEQGADGDVPLPAVLVQLMIDADVAGVAFAADPVSGNRDTAVVAATAGVGEALVSGECQGDTWHVGANGRIIFRDIEAAPLLTDRQIRRIAKLVRSVSEHFGVPQDIEWALRDGRLYLLQSRDITALPTTDSRADFALWDNSNIVESYGGVTTPLTFSVARSAYQEAYRHFGRVLGVSERDIARNQRAYEQMIGLIRGRVYYNLLSWYRLLMLTPGFRFNRKFMEQMMGVTEGLPQDALPARQDGEHFAGIRAVAGLIRVGRRLVARIFRHNSRVRKFHQTIDTALQTIDLESRSLSELLNDYELLEARVIPAWDTPLVNDLYCMIFHGALRALCERWFDENLAGIHNELISGGAGIVSMEPVRRMQEMAIIAAGKPKFVAALRNGGIATINRHIEDDPRFSRALDAYIARFGDRCLDELKLESPTVADDPLPLLRTVGQMAGHTPMSGDSDIADDAHVVAERKVKEALAASPVRRLVLLTVLKLAKARVRDRENLRFERTRVYGRVRAIFLEIGRRFAALQVLQQSDDIFYLDVDEITGIIRGTGSSCSWSGMVQCRREEFALYVASDDPPRRFVTQGPAQLCSSMQHVSSKVAGDDAASRTGQACSPGVVRGQVRIVRDARAARIQKGEILVAQRTDPGWVMIFPLVSGMIMERGSLLSHSAIVARELRIPAVVGVEDACRWLTDGDWVELDGATGSIRKLGQHELAA